MVFSRSTHYENMDSLKAKGIVDKFNTNYQVCGRDNGGRSIMWIGASKPSQISEEQIVVHSGILYWMAVHSDLHTLREGCTFVIDTSKQKGVNKVGNEKKLQIFDQVHFKKNYNNWIRPTLVIFMKFF